MRRRDFVIGLALALPHRVALGNRPSRGHRIVFPYAMSATARERITRLLAEHGFVVGRNLTLDIVPIADPTEGAGPGDRRSPEEQERMARALVASRPDVIAMPAFIEVDLFRRLTSDIPIVFYHYGSDPVQAGWVQALHRPGRNLTGTMQTRVDATSKFWSLLKQLRPDARYRATLLTTEYLAEGAHWELVRARQAEAAAALGLQIALLSFQRSASFQEVRALIENARIHVLVVALGLSWPGMQSLIDYVRDARIPALYLNGGAAVVKRGGAHRPFVRPGLRRARRDRDHRANPSRRVSRHDSGAAGGTLPCRVEPAHRSRHGTRHSLRGDAGGDGDHRVKDKRRDPHRPCARASRAGGPRLVR